MSRKELPSSAKQRLDSLLVTLGLADSLEQARQLVMAGKVLVNDRVHDKPGMSIPVDAAIRLRGHSPYVSRGGLKLEAALTEFGIDVTGRSVVDVGASTGGFTDCLLQHNAGRVYAVDVGYGQLNWKLRNDRRVVCLERTNIRHLHELPGGELADLAVIDASFVGLALVLPATLALLTAHAQIVALIKPQFEAEKTRVEKGGVIRDPEAHRQVLDAVWDLAEKLGLTVEGLIVSPLLGPAGNTEFLIWLDRDGERQLMRGSAIEMALKAAEQLRRDP